MTFASMRDEKIHTVSSAKLQKFWYNLF